MRYFASGSNHQGEIEGLALVGMNVGVAAPELNEAAIGALEALPANVLVFVDSGAFSEVVFDPAPRIANRIEHGEWIERLALYERLARRLGSQLYPVAPDCVAHQEESLARLERYAGEVRRLRDLGANVIVPIQKGALSMAAFDQRACELLGFDDFVRGVPMKKDATRIDELVGLLRERPQARRVHLLGIGPKSARWDDVVAALDDVRPGLDFSADSVLLKSLIGKDNGPGGGPRAFTKAHDELWANELAPRAFYDERPALDWTDHVGGVGSWAGPAARRKMAAEIAIAGDEAKAFVKDPDAWLQDDDRYLWPHVEVAVDGAWRDHYFAEIVVERKREAVVRCFPRPRGQLLLF